MTNCRACGTPLAEGAPFCLQCGLGPDQQPASKWVKPLIVGGVAVIALFITWGLSASGIIAVGGSQQPALGASAETSQSSLAVFDEANDPTLAANAELPPPSMRIVAGEMPLEISHWLDHLLQTHNRLRGLNRSLTSEHTSAQSELRPGAFSEDKASEAAIDDARRRGEAGSILESVREFFRNLHRDFRSVPPPRECVPIAELYGASLEDIPTMIEKLTIALNQLDIGMAESVGQEHRIIEKRISQTNRLIEELCARYSVENRWRLVEDTDFGLGGSMGLGGLGLSGEALKQYGDMLRGLLEDE